MIRLRPKPAASEVLPREKLTDKKGEEDVQTLAEGYLAPSNSNDYPESTDDVPQLLHFCESETQICPSQSLQVSQRFWQRNTYLCFFLRHVFLFVPHAHRDSFQPVLKNVEIDVLLTTYEYTLVWL